MCYIANNTIRLGICLQSVFFPQLPLLFILHFLCLETTNIIPCLALAYTSAVAITIYIYTTFKFNLISIPSPQTCSLFLAFPRRIFFLTWKKVSTLILMYRCIQHSAIHPYTIHNYTCWRKHRHKQPTNTTTKTTKNKRKTPEWMENLKEQKNETSEKLCKWHSGKCSKGCGRRWECKYGMYKKRRKIVYKITGAFKNIQMKLSRSH